ncbi:Glu-tRNA(Gln) amidotransferase subunit GatE [Ferroplasma sp.]|uniref:Glu-tRNA(Gln) amidotransferase subunit GatE n=1 Tax=Ferroplasma sp. TaxID=2591003 RepID=UPI00307F55AF
MKIGLEIHFQLKGNKLFCSCSTEGADISNSFSRKLTPVMGEMGKMDTAVAYETIRNRNFKYTVSSNACLVEMDEEPPHPVNDDALKTSIAISEALHCKVMDYASFMRKIVVDGSNTSGFQRTGIIGMDGYVSTPKGNVRVSTITLEEDACRKISEKNDSVEYSLDRLGIPLIEISTEPDIIDPDHALETARNIGHYVMSMQNFRGEVDSIRQDVNFSMGFGRVEIKGVSKLSFIKDTIEYEIARQTSLKEISGILADKNPVIGDFKDITEIFANTESGMIKKAISSGKSVMCARVSHCNKLMKHGNYKLGREFADVAKNMGIGGLMHSDEFPAYGISSEELEKLYLISEKNNDDAVIVVLSDKLTVSKLKPLLDERLDKILKMQLEETRAATANGETRYLRPLAGKERMYPETDIPVTQLTEAVIESTLAIIPKSLAETIGELTGNYGLSSVESEALINNNLLSAFKSIINYFNNAHLLARVLLQTIPEMEKRIGRKLNDREMEDLLGKQYKNQNGTGKEGTSKSILQVAEKKGWNKDALEKAISLYLLEKVPLDQLENYGELNMLNDEQIRKIIGEIMEQENVNEKNLIFIFRKYTKSSFNPAEVIKIFGEIQK